MRVRAVIAALVLSALALSGCQAPAPDPTSSGPRPLTEAEAQLLAVVRLNNLREGTRTVSIDVPTEGSVDGAADFATHLGYGRLIDGGQSAGLVSWDLGTVAFRGIPTDDLPFPQPADGWTITALDPSTSKLAASLAVVLNLADDRADNYLLLQQEGGQFIRTDSIDGIEVDVLRAPSGGGTAVLDYWVDADGLMHRVDIDFGEPQPTVILFGPSDGITVPPLPPTP